MAFEADCGVSTVLEALRVASAAGFLVPGDAERPAALATRPSATAARRLEAPSGRSHPVSETHNSKLITQNYPPVCGKELRIEN
jgi:hypothetical protein